MITYITRTWVRLEIRKKTSQPSARRSVQSYVQQVFDYAIDPSRRRSRNGKKIGRPRVPQPRRRVEHARREEVSPRHPVHVTLRVLPGLPGLRCEHEFAAIVGALSTAKGRHGLCVTEFTVLNDHMHLIVELDLSAPDAPGADLPPARRGKLILSRGLQGLKVRLARALNKVWKRKGSVFADRYHAEAKTNPTMVARAKSYVLNNARKHDLWRCEKSDPYSSAVWAPFLSEPPPPGSRADRYRDLGVPIVAPRTWLGTMCWSRARTLAPATTAALPPHRESTPHRNTNTRRPIAPGPSLFSLLRA